MSTYRDTYNHTLMILYRGGRERESQERERERDRHSYMEMKREGSRKEPGTLQRRERK